MKIHFLTNLFKPLLLPAVAFVFAGLWGCDKETAKPEVKSFERLLENETIQSKIFNRSVNYAVLLPENYHSSEDSFPVVYLLHGFGDNQTAWYKSGSIKYYSDQYASGNVPMIFVMPQGFNSYYVNRYSGGVPYMDFFTREFVPEIDSIYRTKKDRTQRAVMGYSMGGYGALILPAMNPELFSISVPLSMSFRTDEQYMAEPAGVFDSQWGIIFGGMGTTGGERLTGYFKQFSPFHFFAGGDLSRFNDLKILVDCGDDEETLSITNNALHCLMRDNQIQHEYRVRDGAHSWDYWHASLKEALTFISSGFRGEEYNQTPETTLVGDPVPAENRRLLRITGTETDAAVLIPPSYDSIAGDYPVIFFFRDYTTGNQEKEISDVFSLFYNGMLSSKLPKLIVIEFPCDSQEATLESVNKMISQADNFYRTKKARGARILMGNGKGGGIAASYVISDSLSFGSCALFSADLQEGTIPAEGDIFYYLDECDEGRFYRAYNELYKYIREKGNKYEYRVRQGDDSFESLLNGLSLSFPVLKQRFSNT